MRPFFLLAFTLCAGSVQAQAPVDLEAVVTTDFGAFRFEFAPEKAPNHVAKFIERARAGYYDGSAFFHVVANGMIQGGDPLLKDPKTPKNLWGTGGLSLMPAEISDMKHERGVVSTINVAGKANSDGAQFFVCVVPQPGLDGQYSAFGRVTEGMPVVEQISRSEANDKPVRILKVTIEPKKQEPFRDASIDELRRTVTMKTTLGTIRIKMEPDWAPNHVRRFLMLTQTGWYNGTAFHRIAKGFVAQGGTGESRSSGPAHDADRWVHPLKGEFRTDVKHVRGIVSMAHGDDPDSATTSFFLMLGDGTNLDGGFSAFGRIIDGLDVLTAFEKEETDGETPRRRIEIIEATIE
jgi:peptidylprolyl isomerase